MLDSLRGRALTPIDPMADDVITGSYGKILLITIPLLTLGGMILGYMIMTSRTTGESAYSGPQPATDRLTRADFGAQPVRA